MFLAYKATVSGPTNSLVNRAVTVFTDFAKARFKGIKLYENVPSAL